MRAKTINMCLVVVVLLFVSCASKSERMVKGKWTLSGSMVGGAPTSYWFKGGGTLVAPWESRKSVLESMGRYEFIDSGHLKIILDEGYYKGNIYFFEVIKLNEKEMVLRTNYQEIKLKKTM